MLHMDSFNFHPSMTKKVLSSPFYRGGKESTQGPRLVRTWVRIIRVWEDRGFEMSPNCGHYSPLSQFWDFS